MNITDTWVGTRDFFEELLTQNIVMEEAATIEDRHDELTQLMSTLKNHNSLRK